MSEDSGRTQFTKKTEHPDGKVETEKHYVPKEQKVKHTLGDIAKHPATTATGGSAAAIIGLLAILQFQPGLLPYASADEVAANKEAIEQHIAQSNTAITRAITEFDLRRSIKDAAIQIDELAQDIEFTACRQEGCAWERSMQGKLERRQMQWREDLRLLVQ